MTTNNGDRDVTTTYDYLYRRVARGTRFSDPDTLAWRSRNGRTIAHLQAWYGWTTDDPAILALVNEKGWTVAHEQAAYGWTTTDPVILAWATHHGTTVADTIAQCVSLVRIEQGQREALRELADPLTEDEGEAALDTFHRLVAQDDPYALTRTIEHVLRIRMRAEDTP